MWLEAPFKLWGKLWTCWSCFSSCRWAGGVGCVWGGRDLDRLFHWLTAAAAVEVVVVVVVCREGGGGGGGDSYLYLGGGAGGGGGGGGVPADAAFVVVVVRLQPGIRFSSLLQPGEVEVRQQGRELDERLQQDSEHGADHVLERGESQRVAARWTTISLLTLLSPCVCVCVCVCVGLSRLDLLTGTLVKSEIEASRKSPWKWKVEVEWGSGPELLITVNKWAVQTARDRKLYMSARR